MNCILLYSEVENAHFMEIKNIVGFIIFLNGLENEIDNRQKHKAKHKLSNIF